MSHRGFKMESTDPSMADVVLDALELWLEANPNDTHVDQVETHVKMIRAAKAADAADPTHLH